MIEIMLQPLDKPRYSSPRPSQRTVLIGLVILGTILAVPLTMQAINVPAVHASSDQPPVEQCAIWTYGPSGNLAGLGGYDPDGSIVSGSVNWGDGSTDSSTVWNYSCGSNLVVTQQFGHLFT